MSAKESAVAAAADPKAATWFPTPQDIENAHVTALVRRFDLPDYDALYRFSIESPEAYWPGVVEFLGIVWSRMPEGYVDLSRGSPFPRWFPGGELNWVDTVLARADDPAAAQRPAVIAERENSSVVRVTYAELAGRVRDFAAGLAGLGVHRGERIGLVCENGLEATVAFLALAHLGAVAVPLFSGFGAEAITTRLSACGARGLIASTGFERRGRWLDMAVTVGEALRQLPVVDLVIWKTAEGKPYPPSGIAWATVAGPHDAPSAPAARMAPDDPFMVIYTSGTTGRPKGAVHTHGGFPLKIAHDAAVHLDLGPGDVFCWPADMGWIAGSLVLAAALMRGATLVTYDGAPDWPDWSRLSRLVERHRVTHLGSAPTLIRGLAGNAAQATTGDLSTVELLITAGEVIDPDHFCWFQRAFGRGTQPLINYTGGTEASGGLLSSVVVRPIRAAGFNTASPGVRMAVVDAEGRPVRDVTGELAVLAPFVGTTRSFWEDDARYLATYWSRVPGIWVHGDLAVQTVEGDFFMLGRSDDTLKIAGKRLGPAEVEEALSQLAEVGEAAAIGVDDPAKGQKLVVFVVPAPGWHGDAAALAQVAAQRIEARLGRAFRPGAVHVVAQLPRTRSSKVMRRLIRAVYAGLPPGDLSSLDNPAALAEIERAAAQARTPAR